MKLIDMKRTVKSEKSTMLAEETRDEYPWGLRISLDGETMAKLGMTELPKIDAEFKLVALVCAVSISENETSDGEARRNVELQIEQMMLMPAAEEEGEDEGEDMAKKMYPSMLG